MQGKMAVRIPEVYGRIAGPDKMANSLIHVTAVYYND